MSMRQGEYQSYLEAHPRRHKAIVVAIAGVAVLVVLLQFLGAGLAAYLLPVLAVLLGVELVLLLFTVKLDRLPGVWRPLGSLALVVAGVVVYVIGGLTLTPAARWSVVLPSSLIGVAVTLLVIRLDHYVPDRPRLVTLVVAIVVLIGIVTGVLAILHTVGMVRGGLRATVIAAAHMGVVATIGVYTGVRLYQRGPVGVFPGVVERLRPARD